MTRKRHHWRDVYTRTHKPGTFRRCDCGAAAVKRGGRWVYYTDTDPAETTKCPPCSWKKPPETS